jgi:flavin reductase (DIM6/NTAB) family NADH-FMN oxidoreductase RutF
MVVGSFASISLSPPLVAFASDRASKTWLRIVEAGRFCVNVLANDQLWLCHRFSGRSEDRFESIAYRKSSRGMPIIDGVVAWIDCVVHAIHTAGDHHIMLGQVESIDTAREAPPLLFLRGGFGQFAPLP